MGLTINHYTEIRNATEILRTLLKDALREAEHYAWTEDQSEENKLLTEYWLSKVNYYTRLLNEFYKGENSD